MNGGALRPAVVALDVEPDASHGVVVHTVDGHRERFAAAIFTPQLHLLETGVEVRSTIPGPPPLGPRMCRAIRSLHYWQSSKTALVVDQPFWKGTTLDGVTLTDRLPRAVYTLDYGPACRPGGRSGVLYLSFTWAQDATKISDVEPGREGGPVRTGLGGHPPRGRERAPQASAFGTGRHDLMGERTELPRPLPVLPSG
ncbi:FAD-dependent oxidoreductase [Streptomyces sp. NPDC048416]|uniref:FAD-dependent oxidoreductase n=1 Tax=Streptomyces sp. NPDC048416 TaxID=3365546 RepID=UPI00371A9F25